MATKRTLNINGQDVEVVDLDFEPVKEPWNEYALTDGGRIRIKLSVQRVMQILDSDGKPARTADGDRFIVVQSQNQLVVQD